MIERLAGRYEIHREIAAGGMATVHIGTVVGARGAGRTVAVKRLHAQFAKDPEFSAMLLDEARLTSRISHPNVVATLEAVAQGGELFVVMEYVRGETLSRLLGAARKRDVRMPPRIAASIVYGVLLGLHAAHEAVSETGEPLHIVHRDVSPQNILVGSDGLARVLDFGVAKAKGRSRTTRDGQIRGKIGYMAPEQLHGETVTRRTDVYAASIVLWEALTGTRLFDGDTEAEVIGKVASAVALPPSLRAAGVPSALDAVTLRGLSREMKWRYGTAQLMAEALQASIELAPPAEVGAWVESMAGEVLRERSEIEATVRSPPTPRRGRRAAVVVAFGLASVAAVLAARARRPDEPGSSVSSASSVTTTPPAVADPASAPSASAAPEPTPLATASAPPHSVEVDASSAVPPRRNPKAPRRATASCDPPFTVDAAGRRHFKVECL